jgi:hypothetical protein
MLAACGGGESPTSPDPTPSPPPPPAVARTTLTLDIKYIEVVGDNDCDGIEGDGDFHFQLTTGDADGATLWYDKDIQLGPAGRTPALGRKASTFDAVPGATVQMSLVASEWDKDILGNVYPDSRLEYASAKAKYVFDGSRWPNLGARSITLGSGGCQVRLSWTASAS